MARRRRQGQGQGGYGGKGRNLVKMIAIIIMVTACTLVIAINSIKTTLYSYQKTEHTYETIKYDQKTPGNNTMTTTSTTSSRAETHAKDREEKTASITVETTTSSSTTTTTTATRIQDVVSHTNGDTRIESGHPHQVGVVVAKRRTKADEVLFPAMKDTTEENTQSDGGASSPCVGSVFHKDMQPPPRNSHKGFLHELERELCVVTRGGETRAVVVLFANSAYSKMLSNVVHSLRIQGVQGILVGALDADVERFARQNLDVAAIQVGNETALMDTETILAKMKANQLLIDGNIAQGSKNFRTVRRHEIPSIQNVCTSHEREKDVEGDKHTHSLTLSLIRC